MSTATELMTFEEFIAIPDDGIHRELWAGRLVEYPLENDMPYRNRFHAVSTARCSKILGNWSDSNQLDGQVANGDVGVLLENEPDTTVGIDVAYFSAETLARQTDAMTIIVGAPVLAVEVISPSDRVESIRDKVLLYLSHGVAVVWLVDPYFKTLQVHRRGTPPMMLNDSERYENDASLPGLAFDVAGLFS